MSQVARSRFRPFPSPRRQRTVTADGHGHPAPRIPGRPEPGRRRRKTRLPKARFPAGDGFSCGHAHAAPYPGCRPPTPVPAWGPAESAPRGREPGTSRCPRWGPTAEQTGNAPPRAWAPLTLTAPLPRPVSAPLSPSCPSWGGPAICPFSSYSASSKENVDMFPSHCAEFSITKIQTSGLERGGVVHLTLLTGKTERISESRISHRDQI